MSFNPYTSPHPESQAGDDMDVSNDQAPAAYMSPSFDSTDFMASPSATEGSRLNNRGVSEQAPPSTKQSDDQHAPAWAELKTKAGKDRKRLPLACIACRRKKIRCSGEKPACKHCLKSRIPCVYKVTTRKAAPRTDYMAMLDKRLKRMEDRVIKIIPKDEVPDVPRAVVKPNATQIASKNRAAKKRSADEAFGELAKWAEKTSLSEPGSGPSSAPKKASIADNSFLTEGAEYLPPKEMQFHLAEVYFDYVYGQSYPLLHKPSFMRRLEAGTVPPVLVLAVCAISARFSNHPSLQAEPTFSRGETWAKPALEISLKRFDSPNITILIVYVLLGTHEFATCQGGRSWMLGGMAHRMAYALQLHKDLDMDIQHNPSVGELSFTDREIRRRTMWSCFMMDRFNSSGTQRPMFASEQYMHLQLPIREDLYLNDVAAPTETLDGTSAKPSSSVPGQMDDPKENMGVAAYTVKIIVIWGRLIQYLNLGGKEDEEVPMWSPKSTHRKLCDELAEFDKSLPDRLRYSEDNLQTHNSYNLANQFLYLHIAYNHCILFINRFSIPTTANSGIPKDMPAQFLHNATSQAIDAAGKISKLIEKGSQYRVTAPYAGYCAVTSSAVHIYNIFASQKSSLEKSSRRDLATNIAFLNKMKKYWGFFQFLTETIKDLFRQYAEGTTTPNRRNKTMWQYGDWYDRYPHGVSKTDLEEPKVTVEKVEGEDAVLSQKSDFQSVEQFFDSLSPTSKAARQANSGSKVTAKGAKRARKAAKQESPAEPSQRNTSASSRYNPTYDALEMPNSPFGPPESYDRSPINPQLANPVANKQMEAPASGAQTAPQTFDPAFNFEPAQQPSFMPQLDRQMVMASYNGFGPPSMLDGNGLWDMDLGTLGTDGFSTEPNHAWFTPFNINPPMQDFLGIGDLDYSESLMGDSNFFLSSAVQDPNESPDMGRSGNS